MTSADKTQPHPDELLAVAHVTRPHGIRGELSAVPLAPPVFECASLIVRRLFMRTAKGEVRPVQGLAVRPHQNRWLITLEGVEDRTQADALREIDLCLTRDELPPLPEGWYWESELQRCRVIDKTLGEIGRVHGLNLDSSQPRLEIIRPDDSIATFPWVKAFLVKVDLESSEIHIDLPPGMPGISD